VKALFLLLCGLLATSQAMACECPVPLTSEDARKATNVFVFRLLGTQMDPNTNSYFDEAATGRVQVVANVRGKTTAKEIVYSTSRFCCGLKLATGAYYIAVLDEDAKRFNASPANLIGLQIGFGRSEADLLESVLFVGKASWRMRSLPAIRRWVDFARHRIQYRHIYPKAVGAT
jgi:hypothetical protein